MAIPSATSNAAQNPQLLVIVLLGAAIPRQKGHGIGLQPIAAACMGLRQVESPYATVKSSGMSSCLSNCNFWLAKGNIGRVQPVEECELDKYENSKHMSGSKNRKS